MRLVMLSVPVALAARILLHGPRPTYGDATTRDDRAPLISASKWLPQGDCKKWIIRIESKLALSYRNSGWILSSE